MTKSSHVKCDVCIVGGGPAGMIVGFLLARAGIEVVVLEKHGDFFRDFRGDTIHPSTMQILYELGILESFLDLPHQEIETIFAHYYDLYVAIIDFKKLRVARPRLGFVPQWDFLNFLAKQAADYPSFRLIMNACATELITEKNETIGVKANISNGTISVLSNLIIAADGRHSTIRKLANLNVMSSRSCIDVLCFRLPKLKNDPEHTFLRFYNGRVMVFIERGNYWHCDYVIEKDGFDEVKLKGLAALKTEMRKVSPFLDEHLNELKDWNNIKLLSVRIDHLEKWYCDGILCIGDAAHAMSPVGGVGINLAIGDAVATANILYKTIKNREKITIRILRAVQKRRQFPMRIIQFLQITFQNEIIHKYKGRKRWMVTLSFKLVKHIPILRYLSAHIIGMGVRPEHVKTPQSNCINSALNKGQ